MNEADAKSPGFPPIRIWAQRTPQAIALLAPERKSLTFAMLLRRIEAMEEDLARLGVRPNGAVALAMPDGPELAVALLGVGSGRACAPLNPSLTAQEFESCLSTLGAAALITAAGSGSTAAAAARSVGVPVLDLTPLPKEPAGCFTLALSSDARPAQVRQVQDAAVLLFTSATTGKPKLVPLSHDNLHAICRNTSRALQLGPADRFLSLMPLFHLQGLISILVQWFVGGSVVCTSRPDPDQFSTWLSDFCPTWYTAGPTLHHTILASLTGKPVPCRLRFVRSIGAPLTPELWAALESALGAPVLEGYGLTETGLVTSNPLPPGRRKPGSVGIRLETEIDILNANNESLPMGQEGEIVLRGPAVTSGYLDPAEANPAAFINGWLRTGDAGRFDEEGYLYITGRLKEMINRGGEKIMPQEIDRALAAHAGVAEAAVFAVPHPTLGEDAIAAVVLRPGAHLSESSLRDFVALRIAPFKVPQRIVFLDQIPKGPTGKPNRLALTEQYRTAARQPCSITGETVADSDGSQDSEHSRITLKLAKIWAEILGMKHVNPNDNFFEMGGHSLMVAHLFTRIEREFGKKLPLDTLFHAPTAASLARILCEEGMVTALSRIVVMQAKGALPPFFMIRPLPIFRPLVRRLPQDRPFFGLTLPNAPLFSGKHQLEDIAGDLIRIILRLQPSGPYHLGGWCADGVLAYEMARQLEARGETIALLALFDSPNPAYLKELPRRQAAFHRLLYLARDTKYHFASLRQLGKSEIPGYIGERAKAIGAIVLKRLAGVADKSSGRSSTDRSLAWRPSGMRVWIADYRPEPIRGTTVLFRSTDWRTKRPGDETSGWASAAGDRFLTHQIPGGHHGIFLKPHVRILAERLAALLAEG